MMFNSTTIFNPWGFGACLADPILFFLSADAAFLFQNILIAQRKKRNIIHWDGRECLETAYLCRDNF